MLEAVFITYFRVLKKSHTSPLLPAILEGLAKYAHLIDVSFVPDIMAVLKEIVVDRNLSLVSALQCIVTAFQALRNQADTFSVDLKDFYEYFYALLPDVASASPLQMKQAIELTVRCLELMLIGKRQLPLSRVAAYAKRVGTLALHLPPNAAIALIRVLESIFTGFPKAQQLLDVERVASGIYHPEIDEPGLNALALALHLLTN